MNDPVKNITDIIFDSVAETIKESKKKTGYKVTLKNGKNELDFVFPDMPRAASFISKAIESTKSGYVVAEIRGE